MKKLHHFSGLVLIVFISLHLLNHLISLWGVEAHIEFMEFARKLYRNPVSEALLMLAIGGQVYSGVRLLMRKSIRQAKGFDRWQIYSGLYLAFFLMAHTSAILVGRYYFEADTNFYFGAMPLNAEPFVWIFVPYYSMGVMAFFVHMACIHRLIIQKLRPSGNADSQARFIILLGAVVLVLILMGMTAYFSGIDIPDQYKAIMGQYPGG